MAGEEKLSAEDHAQAVFDAEAASRRAESEAAVLRGRAARSNNPGAFKQAAREAFKEEIDARQEEDRVRSQAPARDLEGTQSRLSDIEGNFAATAEVAATGGIGIDASNTNVATGQPAKTAEEAGVATEPGAQKIIGDHVVGEGTARDTLDHDQNGRKGGVADLDAMTVDQLKAHAAKRKIDLGDATLKADIRAAIDRAQA